MKDRGTKDRFCKSLAWPEVVPGISWYDKQGVFQLDEDRRVTITLEERGQHDHWMGFMVRLFNKKEGEIAWKWFAFNDYLGPMEGRVNGGPPGFQVIGHVGWKWYQEKPKTTLPFTEAIRDWIAEWK